MAETYKVAHARLMTGLAAAGWTLSRPGLKIAHATRPDGVRVWFLAQAVHAGTGTIAGDARSLWIDARATSVDQLIAVVGRWFHAAR